ncbi:hypothetical protein ACIBAC_19230 [Streptomyces sp. NPDC051362]|uniref:hypothetical protein n=1 Tax=Streptomyces sp. NPDC051362 TaxID=3365651 RepID=UPI0037B0A6DB
MTSIVTEVEVVAAAAAPQMKLPDPWIAEAFALSPVNLRQMAKDRRWETWWTIARQADGAAVGILPMYIPKASEASEPIYDPRQVAPACVGGIPDDARKWAYIGGFRDLVAGSCVAAGLTDGELSKVRGLLADRAFGFAMQQGLQPFMLYVTERELIDFQKGIGKDTTSAAITERAILDGPWDSIDTYLASLPSSRRYSVRRDFRAFEKFDLVSEHVPAEEMYAEASHLIAKVKRRHGVADHPRLIEMRLRNWGAWVDEAECILVRDGEGLLLAASFVAFQGDAAEVYEAGLVDDHPARHVAYVEVLCYGPLRCAVERGVRSIGLGLDSVGPKSLRGARLEKVWGLGLQ